MRPLRTRNPSVKDLPNLDHYKDIVVDVETDGLDWRKTRAVGFVITVGPTKNETWYFPTRHAQGGNCDHRKITDWIKDKIASREDVRLIGHHFKFDLHYLANEGIEFRSKSLECTMVNAAILNENAGKYDLESCAERMGVTPKKGEVMYKHLATLFDGEPNKKQMANFWRTAGDDPVVNEYASGDGISTWQLWQEQQKAIGEQDLWQVHLLECKVLRTLFRMERIGIRIDVDKMKELKLQLGYKYAKTIKEFTKDFNPRSPIQMKTLMEKYRQTNWPMTAPSKKFPTGQPSFPEEWLKTHVIGRKVISSRKLSHMLSTFIDPVLERHEHRGRIHTTYNQLKMDDYGVVSGRLSSSQPNLTGIPKRDKTYAPMLRDTFLPERGCLWSSNDYQQQEFVVFAHYSKAKALVEGYKAEPPIDAHQVVANKMNVERNPTGKRLNLAQVYGQGITALSSHLGITEAEGKKLSQEYHTLFPEARQLYSKAQTTARNRGYIKTISGRRRRFPNKNHCWTAMNQLIQGSSADITKQKMVEVDEFFESEGGKAQLQLQIHDDLNWSYPDNPQGKALNDHAIEIMQSFGEKDAITLDVPLRVDHESGDSWGMATFPKWRRDGK